MRTTCSIFATYWWVSSAGYTGDVYLPLIANATVHAIMYFYYLLSTLGLKPTWGKYLTQMQMLQFVFMIAHGVYSLANDCPYPQTVIKFYIFYIAGMLALFGSFYLAKHKGEDRTGGGASKDARKAAAVEDGADAESSRERAAAGANDAGAARKRPSKNARA